MAEQTSTIPSNPACRDTCGAGRWKETTLGEVAKMDEAGRKRLKNIGVNL